MTIQDLGSIGELVAAIATVMTLAYLALQIRQNTRSVLSATELELMAAWNHLHVIRSQDPQLNEILVRGLVGSEPLNEIEASRFASLCFSQMNLYQATYHQYRRGVLAQELWDARERSLSRILRLPGLRVWLDDNLFTYSESFAELVRAKLAETKPEPAA